MQIPTLVFYHSFRDSKHFHTNMILLKTWSILLFCLISVSAQDAEKGESSKIKEKEVTADIEAQPSTNVESKIGHKPIAKASKVSEFYIGDLLRTSDKDQLETSSTVHNPLSSTPEYRNHRIPEDASIIAGYKAPAGHVYAGEDIILSLTQHGRIPLPVQLAGDRSAEAYEKVPVQQAGVLLRNAIPSEGGVPVSRRYEPTYNSHKGSDCKKHAHTPSASEERYVSNGRVPYSEGRSSPPSAEYRNPERYRDEDSYEDSPSHSSQPAPGYSETYPSKSKSYTSEHDSDTRSKSKSMDSYTTSKSTSSSRTVNPKNKGGKVFVFNNRKPAQESFSSRPREQGSRKKNKQRPSHDSASYSDEPPSYQSSHEDEPPAQYHHQSYPPQAPTRHSSSSHSNSQSAGAPKQSHHYSEQPAPAHHERGSYRKPKEPQNTRYYKDEYSQPEAPVRQHSPPPKYHSTEDAEEPSGPYRTRNEQPYANEPPSHHHGGNRPQNSGSYNSPRQYRDTPQYQQEAPPSRQPKGRRNPNYGGYSQENSPPRSEVPYERNPVPPQSPGMKRPEYAYEETPYMSNESNENYQRPRRPAGRTVRSSTEHYKPGVGEVTADSRESVQHRARELIVKENLPQQYGSVSFSESSYNMGEPPTTKMAPLPKKTNVQSRMYERPEKMINPLLSVPQGNEGRDPGYQTSYNPSSYAPEQYPRDPHGPEPHSAEQDYEPESYEEPHEDPEENYDSHSPKGHTKTKSDITGYKDSYDTHEPLDLDDAFFEKYGISKNAKIIVATPMNPGLFVADGTGIAEGGESDDDSHERINEEPSSNQNSREPVEYSPKIEADDEVEEPKSQFELPREAPGSFTQLVDFNPRFMRKLKRSKRPEIGEFQEYDPSLDELVFRSGVGDPKEFVRSQGSREIVQQHGDGVSRIIFNQVTKKQKEAASENKEEYLPNQEASEEKLESAKVEKVLKPETVVEKSA